MASHSSIKNQELFWKFMAPPVEKSNRSQQFWAVLVKLVIAEAPTFTESPVRGQEAQPRGQNQMER